MSDIIVDEELSDEAVEAAADQVTFDISSVMDALLADMPYEFYWYDKTISMSVSPVCEFNLDYVDEEWVLSVLGHYDIEMPVSADYSVTGQPDTYEVDASTGERVSDAVATATSIAADGSDLGAHDRLAYFKDRICALVSYNYGAAENDDTPYGDPWQLIYVFDGDKSTEVVCEGYAKAFKYLCDLAAIDGVGCNMVTGVMSGGTGAGEHMWNIVNMDDGRNYLVDVTNCDEGSVGHSDLLFIVPYSCGSVEEGYAFDACGEDVTYGYDSDTLAVYTTDELTISATPYDPSGEPELTEGWSQFGSCEWLVDEGVLTIRPLGNSASGVLADMNDSTVEWKAYAEDITRAQIVGGVSAGSSLAGMFGGLSNLETIDFGDFTTSSATDMSAMLEGCSSLTGVELSGFDTSSVVTMESMFEGCSSLASVDVSAWDTSSLTRADAMLRSCPNLEEMVVGAGVTSPLLACLAKEDAPEEAQWWSLADGCWYTVSEIASNREGVADTYTLEEGEVPVPDLANAQLTVEDQVYTGSPLTPTVSVVLDGESVPEDGYEVGYRNNVDAGTATVVVTGAGFFTGSNSTTFQIVPASIGSGKTVANGFSAKLASNSVYFKDESTEPAVTLKRGGMALKKGADYSVTYSGGKVDPSRGVYSSKATATVTGKGNYTGSVKLSYTVYCRVITKKVKGTGTVELRSATMYPKGGDTVTFRTIPGVGKTIRAFNVTYTDPATGERVKLIKDAGLTRTKGTGAPGTVSEYSFAMPGAPVTINAVFDDNPTKYKIAKNMTGAGAKASNLQLVGSDRKPPETTRDKVKPTMYPKAGQTVYFLSKPGAGYKLSKFNVTYSYKGLDGKTVSVKLTTGHGITSLGNGLYSFTMPCYKVTLTGEFVKK